MTLASRSLLVLPLMASAVPYRAASLSTVDPDGVRSLLSNPAGLATTSGQEALLQLGGGEPAGHDAVAFKASGFGIGWQSRPWSVKGSEQAWGLWPSNDGIRESSLLIGLGLPLPGGISAGATAVRHVVDDAVQGWSADVGLLWRPFSALSFSWLCPDIARRDALRDHSNTLGVGIRPFGTPDVALSAELFTPTTPWNRTAWDDPDWELGAEIRPLRWLKLDARVDPQHFESYGFGVSLQLRPDIEFFSRSTPAGSGPEFQTAGMRWTSRSRPAVEAVQGSILYVVPNLGTEAGSGLPFRSKPSLARVREDFREMATIGDLRTVVLDLGSNRLSPAQAGVLRRMILDLRRTGREVRVWAADLDMANLHVMSAADKAAMSPEGAVRTRGLAMDVLYFGEFLEKHGVAVQVAKTGPWKNAMEPFEKASMSDETKTSLSRILFDLDSMILGGVAEARGVDPAALLRFVDTGSTISRAALANRLVDTLLDREDLAKWAKGRKMSLRLAGVREESWDSPARVAVVPVEGQIVDRSGDAGMVPWNRSLAAEAVSRRIDALAKDPRVSAVVLRVQSPGGSVVGSERLRRAVARLAKAKPVVASFGHTAASGGYMLALPSARIFSEPESMVGSIGVFAAKFSVGGLLDSLGIKAERVRTAPHAGAMSPWNPLDSLERARMTEYVEDAHSKFAAEVRSARKLDSAAFSKVDGGRVFCGARAKDLGLVDTLGGLDDAVRWAAAKSRTPTGLAPLWIDPSTGGDFTEAAQAISGVFRTDAASTLATWERALESTRPTLWSQSWEPRWE